MKKLMTLFAFVLVAFTANAQSTLKGDVNGDGEVNVTDVTMIVEHVLGQHNSSFIEGNADVNGDGDITVTDVAEAVNTILDGNGGSGSGIGDTSQSYLTCPDNNHPHMIDLGLPSGTLWACCNVGATKPEEYGGYYAWGETEEQDYYYNWATYSHCDGTSGTCHNLGSDICETQYDVAHVKWGGLWVMPNFTLIQELLDNCTYEWDKLNDVNGMRFTGSNGGSVFLPGAGYCLRGRQGDATGYYWSGTQDPTNSNNAYYLYFKLDYVKLVNEFHDRGNGHSVRPVIKTDKVELILSSTSETLTVGETAVVKITSGNCSYTVSSSDTNVATASLSGNTITITGVTPGTAVMTVTDTATGNTQDIYVTVKDILLCPDDNHPHMIDLGLPSGTLWACCNVGADKPEAYGGYYAWGETDEKDWYDWSTYIHSDASPWTCHSLGNNICGSQYDVAHVKWGGNWQMPDETQIKEMLNNCSSQWISRSCVNGEQYTGPNGNTIFLPAAGHRWYDDTNDNSIGNYWSSTQEPTSSYSAYYLYFRPNYTFLGGNIRAYGLTVRPVYVVNTTEPLSLSVSNVEIKVDETAIVEIISGNGSYAISCSDTNVATASLSGTTITIIGVAPGTAVVTVTDTATGNSQDVSVTVIKKQAYLSCPDDNHPHMIDLGLPSGTLWACCNVEATKPEMYGGYYAWGEASKKDVYNDVTYKYAIGEDNDGDGWYDDNLSGMGYSGIWEILGDDIAGSEFDVAHVKWGGSWVMPSLSQIEELVENCTYEYTSLNDVEGERFTGPNGGTIFLPSAGYRKGDDLSHPDEYGDYWSSTPFTSNPCNAYCLYFNKDEAGYNDFYRANGRSVRPVSVEKTFRPLAVSTSSVVINVGDTETIKITSGNGSYTVSSSETNIATASLSGTTITITGVASGTAVVTVTDTATGNSQDLNVTVSDILTCPDDHHPHMIDLGLPSGTKWACCNVGADKPEANGGYYAWGETKEKNSYDWNTYTYCNGSINTCHNLGDDIAGTQYDVANVKWGADWVMPSYTQFEELLDNCFGKRVIINGVDGYQFTSQNGGAIFLPAAGYRWDKDLYDDSDGYYWTSSQHPTESSSAYYLVFGLDSSNMDYSHCRCDGRNVRPVFLGSTSQSFVLSVNNVEISECETAVVEITSGNGSYTVVSSNIYVATASLSGTTITITGVACGTAVVTVTDTATGNSQDVKVTVSLQAYLTCPDGHHPHLIDLGLESGILWACCNVGANKPDDYGDYYAWGETEVKDYYDWNNYQYYQNDRYVYIGYENKGTQYDVAHEKWGGYWVMPSLLLIEELLGCTREWTTKNGVTGLTFTGPSGGSIFLPAAGYRWGYILEDAGDCGYYWSSSQYRYGSADHAYDMLISQFPEFNENYRYCGHTVRPVWEP